MDPLSAVSGIVGLIAVAVKTIQLVGEYVNVANEHKKHAETIHKELLLMKQVLDQLKDLITEEKRSGSVTSADDVDRHTVLGKAFSDCTKTIEQIQGKLIEPVNKFQKAMAKVKWPFEQKDVLRMVDSLQRYTQLFQLSLTEANRKLLYKTFEAASEGLKAQRDNCKETQRLWASVPEMAKAAETTLKQTESLLKLVPTFLQDVSLDIKEIGVTQRAAEQREQEQRTTDILDWLCPLSALQKHSDLKARRTHGTGQWFLKQEQIAVWMSADSNRDEVLCLGDPGVGKTNLASRVIDALHEMHKDNDIAVIHLYCDYRERQAQTPANCATNMLRQLSMQCNAMPTSISEFYQRTRNEVKDQSWYFELQNILCRVASTFARCFFVFDALDEADSRSQMPGLLELVSVLRSGMTSKAPKIFATSRKHVTAIQESFEKATKVTVTANNEDLRTLLAKFINDHQDSKYILDEELKQKILDMLCERAQGMLLLPILQIQYILSQLTKSEVRRALGDLSANLAEVFKTTIDRIKTLPADQHHSMNRQNLAKKTLMWISHAKRVLTVTELQYALAVRLEDSDLDRENFIEPQLVVDSCFGLVEIDEESSSIRFVHYSLQEYLKSHKHGLFESGDTEVTKVCLKYLLFESVKDLHIKNRESFIKALEELPLLDYAAVEWGCHATNAALTDIEDLALKFLNSSPHLLTAARVRDHRSPYFRKWNERMYAWAYSGGAGISLCASFGLTELLRLLFGQNRYPMLKANNMYGSTPLHEAAMKGHESTARLLLDYGADLLDLNLGKRIPLYLAVANGHIQMAELLLEQQANLQLAVAGKEGWTVLHKAAHSGNEEIVSLVLRKGATVDTADQKRMTPLHLAAREGFLEVVRALLLSGGQVHSKSSDTLTPLDYAVTSGHLEVSSMLLDNGAHIEYCSRDRWTMLHRAARRGHPQLTALLLQKGADILSEDRRGGISLHAAVRSGNVRVVELLLSEKPNLKKDQLSKKERKGSTPADVAFFTAHFEIHKLLRAAEMEAQEHPVTTIDKISSAIESGKKERIRRLLANRSNHIDALVDGRQPALHLAMQEQQIDIVKILLDYGADINSIGYHGWTPLHIAAAIGSLALTKLCLSYGAIVEAVTETAQTSLHKACSSKNVQVVKVLLEAGADKEAENQRSMRPLHIAAGQNDLDMVKLLVQQYGVNVLVADTFGATAADWAEQSGHLELLHYLKSEEKKWKKSNGAILL